MPIFWWFGHRAYVGFIARELTSVLVAYSALLLLLLLGSAARGEAAYEAMVARLASPGLVALHVAVLAGLLFHTITWLILAPQALSPRLAGRRVSARVILVLHYLALLAATAFLLWFLVWRS
jgi:fumarate reductase subunit C